MHATLAALALGIALALAACGGGDDNTPFEAGDEEAPAKAAEAAAPEQVPAEAEEPLNFFDTSGSSMRTTGCNTKLLFRWKADDPSSVPKDAEAVIRVKGPRVSGTYRRRVRSGVVKLRLSTTVNRRSAKFKGTLVSVAGQPVQQISTTHPFLNTSCGRGARPTPPGQLPPNTPVPGAPCTPGAPTPPGLRCVPR